MPQTHPLVVPDWLVTTYQLDLALSYSTNWGFEHHDVAFSAAGEMYALSTIWRGWRGAGIANDPTPFDAELVTRYGPDGMPASTTVLRLPAPDRTPSVVCRSGPDSVCVLPDGNVAVTTPGDSTYLLDSQVGTVLAAYTKPFDRANPDWDAPENYFASRIRVTPGGRLLCTLGEYGVDMYGRPKRNLIALTDAALTAAGKPDVDVIAAAGARRRPTPDHVRPFVRYHGEPLSFDNRPTPSLGECAKQWWPEINWWREPPALRTPTPLADDVFVVPMFAAGFRSGNRGVSFVFALINDQGELTGRLEGLDMHADSPFTGHCYTVAADPQRHRAYHLNRYGLYVWDDGGTLLAKISTDDKPFTTLTSFQLLGYSPGGELVLAHRKQHLLLRVPVRDADGDLGGAVTAALRTYTRERTALKKTFPQTNWHWTYSPGPGHLHHL